MNSNSTQFSLRNPASKTSNCKSLLRAVAIAVGLAMAAVNATYAQVSTINSAVLTTNALDGLPESDLTVKSDYPSLISFVVTNAGTTNTSFSAMQDFWQFATNGGAGAYQFQGSDSFTATMTVTLTGDPVNPRKEAGFAFNDVAGNINGQYILDLDAGEVVAFGGNLPFYATPLDHFYLSGEPITMGITILTDSNGKQAIIYSADGFSSAPLEIGTPMTNYTLGGYFQIQGQGTGSTNLGSATFANISISSLPTDLGIAGTQIGQTVSITGTELSEGAPKDNGKTTTTAVPTKTMITTASVLKDLATDENTAGKYASTTFPAGAKLLYTANTGFQVVDKHNNQLVNVANILTLQTAGQHVITSGTFADATGSATPPFTQTDVQLLTLTYDATGVGGMMKFSVTGVGSSVTTAAKPNAKGNY
jgi:hypothetical protein